MNPEKAPQTLFRLVPPKVSLRKTLRRTTAFSLIFAGLGLPSEAAPLLSPAFAEETARPAAPAQGSEQWMVGVYQEGKRLFDAGDYDGAQREWDKLSGSYDQNPSLKVIVDFMRKRIKEDPETVKRGREFQENQGKAAKKQIEAAGKAKAKKSQPEDEKVAAFLAQARQDVTKQVRGFDQKTATYDSKRAQQQMLALFAKGKQAYLNGNLSQAIAAWDEAVTYLPPNSAAKRELEKLKSNSVQLAEKRNIPVTKPVNPPADMKDFLELVNARFRAESQEGQARVAQRQTSAVDRQDALDKSFQKSKLLYFQGQYEQAIDEMNALAKYFSPDSEEARLIAGVRENYLSSLQAQTEAKEAAPIASVKLQTPADLRSFVDQANRKFDAMIADARARRTAVDKTSAEREGFVRTALERARTYFSAGRVEEALSELERVAPYVENEVEILSLVDEIRAKQAEVERVKAEFDSPDAGETKLNRAATKGISDFLADASRRLEDQKKKIAARRKDVDADVRERSRRLADLFQNAKSRYDAGDLEGALDLLADMAPDVENGDEIARDIDELRQDLADSRRASKELESLDAKREKWPIPSELSSLLSETQSNIRSHADEMRRKRDAAKRSAGENRRAFDEAYNAGRAAYNSGDLQTALSEWEKLVPLVENGNEFAQYLSDVRRDYEAAMEAERSSQKADAGAAALKLPDDFYELLNQTAANARERAQRASSQKQAAEKSVSERSEAFNRAYEAGREAYNAGNLEKAIAEWKALVPLVENGASLGSSLDALQRDYRTATQAIEAAENAEKQPSARLKAPGEIDKMLSDAGRQIQIRAREASERKQTLEKSVGDRRAVYDRAVAEGRAAYQAGDIERAVEAWKALAPVVENGQALEKDLLSVRDQYRSAQQTRAAADALAAQKVSLAPPAELSSALSDISKKLQAETAQSRELAAASETKSAERRKRVEAAISEGLGFYKNGFTAEALQRWESVLPDLADSDRLQKTLFELQRADQELAAVQKAALQSEIDSKKTMPPPADLTKALETAFASASAKLEEAKNRQSGANNESVRRQTIVTEAIQNGKLALARGEVDAAIAEWTKAAPYLEGGAALIPKLQELKAAHVKLVEAQKAAAMAEERNMGKLKSLPEVDAFVTESSLKYKNDTAAAELRRQQAEAAFEEKRAMIEYTVNKAREIFNKGDIPGASLEALKLQTLMEDPVTLQSSVAGIQGSYEQSLKAQTDATAAEERTKNTLFKSPPELALLLKDADMKVKELTILANNQKTEAEQALKEKEAFVQQAFERGKALYWQGKIDEALKEWDTMAPLLEDGGKVKEVTGRYEETITIQRQAREMAERRNEKFQTPEELQRLLNDSEKILSSQSNFATAQQRAAQDELSERQEFINRTFQKGKALYEQGMIPDAIDEWEQLTPLLENGSKVKEFIDSVKASYKETQVAKKSSEEAQARSLVAPEAPADLTRLLAEANQGLQTETQRSREERQKAEEALREKQKMIDGIFQKGKTFYQAGRIEEAIDTWKTLLPFVDDNTSIRQLIQQAEDSRRQLLAERYESQNNLQTAQAPATMQFALEESNAALKEHISQQQAQRLQDDLQAVVGRPALKKPAAKTLPLKEGAQGENLPFKLDEIEQMMLEYKVVTPEELQKRRESLQAASKTAEA